jgi:DNA-3-methyladenine glycosylase
MTKGCLFVEGSDEKFKIVTTTRIGLSKGSEKLLRYYIKGNKFVSRK